VSCHRTTVARFAREVEMLSDFDPMPTLPVSDLQRARDFYEGVLGYSADGDVADGVIYRSGSGAFLVYPSAFAGTNKGTAMSLQVAAGSFDAEIENLRQKGVTFQTFEMEGITWDNGVASGVPGAPDDFRGVWFEDPDGNILSVEVGMNA
jgi:catechol 2,3-dioxygenase-like lactoylglutathione lyase family enzyme